MVGDTIDGGCPADIETLDRLYSPSQQKVHTSQVKENFLRPMKSHPALIPLTTRFSPYPEKRGDKDKYVRLARPVHRAGKRATHDMYHSSRLDGT